MKYESSRAILSKKVEGKMKKESEEKELAYNENLMAEHSEVYKLSDSKIMELKKELEKVVDEEASVKLCDVLPVNKETVKTILLTYNEDIEEETVNKVFEIIKKYIEWMPSILLVDFFF